MSKKEYYNQNENGASWKTKENGRTKYSGNCEYDKDGSLKRWSNVSSFDRETGRHVHEWITKKSDGSYEYGSHDRNGHHHFDED